MTNEERKAWERGDLCTQAAERANFVLLQLPYLNDNGDPAVINIDPYSAGQLVRQGTHKWLRAAETVLVTPKVPAATGVVFQEGEEAL